MAENVFAVTQSDIDWPRASGPIAGSFANSHRVVQIYKESERSLFFISSGCLLPNPEIRIGVGKPRK